MRQVPLPDRTFNLGHVDPHLSDKGFLMHAILNLCWRCFFAEQLQGFDEIASGFLHRLSLAGNIQLRALGHIPVAIALNDGSKLVITHDEQLSLSMRSSPQLIYSQ